MIHKFLVRQPVNKDSLLLNIATCRHTKKLAATHVTSIRDLNLVNNVFASALVIISETLFSDGTYSNVLWHFYSLSIIIWCLTSICLLFYLECCLLKSVSITDSWHISIYCLYPTIVVTEIWITIVLLSLQIIQQYILFLVNSEQG